MSAKSIFALCRVGSVAGIATGPVNPKPGSDGTTRSKSAASSPRTFR